MALARAGYLRRVADLSGKTVAIIVADFVEDAELTTPRDALRDAGAEVRIYSVDGEQVQTVDDDTDPNQKIEVDGSLDDLDVDAHRRAWWCPVAPSTPTSSGSRSRAQDIARQVGGVRQAARGDLPRAVAAGLGRPGRRDAG